jgi:predicted RNase H-like HicB family nuclease
MTLHIESETERAFARETLEEVIRKLEEALALQTASEREERCGHE